MRNHLLLLLSALAPALAAAQDEADESLGTLYGLVTQEAPKDPYIPIRALEKLKLHPLRQEALPAWRSLLKDSRPKVRDAAVKILGSCGPAAAPAVPDLLAMLEAEIGNPNRSQRPDLVESVRNALKSIGDLAELEAGLKKGGSLRRTILEILGSMEKAAAPSAPAIGALARDKDDEVRERVFLAVWRIGPAEWSIIDAAVAAATDKNEKVRLQAIQAMGTLGLKDPAKAVPVLIKALQDKTPGVPNAAAFELGRIGAPAKEAVPALIGMLDLKGNTRRTALVALGKIGPEARAAVPKLVPLLKDPDELTRWQTAEALGGIGRDATEAVPALVDCLQDRQKDHSVFLQAARALGQIGPAASTALPRLIEILQGTDRQSMYEVVPALAGIGEPALAEVLRTLREGKQVQSRYEAARALRLMGERGRKGIESLVLALDDRETVLFEPCRDALASMGPEAVEALIQAAKKGSKGAGKALASIGPGAEQSVSRLAEELRAAEGDARINLVKAIGSIGPGARGATPALIAVLETGDPPARLAACAALERIGPEAKAATPALAKLLRDTDNTPSYAAAQALGAIGPEASSAILTTFTDTNTVARANASVAVRDMKAPTAELLAAVLKALEDPDEWARTRAREALSHHAGKMAPFAKEVSKLLKSQDRVIRSAAARSLASIGIAARPAIPQLQDALQDPDPEVSRWARAALNRILPLDK